MVRYSAGLLMNNKPIKYCFLDTETTGTAPNLHEIYQISAIITDANLNELDSFNLSFRPLTYTHESSALEVAGLTLDDLKALTASPAQAYGGFTQMLSKHCNKYDKTDKMQLVGYNVRFDADFLRAFFQKNHDDYFGSWFWNPPLDVMNAAAWYVQTIRPALVNFKLGTVCQTIGMEWDQNQAHDALYDVRQTIALFKYLRERM